jgi:hypothetical protein
LLDRAYPVVRGDEFGNRAIQQGDRDRHRLWLLFPQPRRALDIGEQQRHRAGRKHTTHVDVTFVTRADGSQHLAPHRR